MGSEVPTGRWVLDSKQKGISSLHYDAAATAPELGPQQVLVRMRAASLNYRDLAIARVRALPSPCPCLPSPHDGASPAESERTKTAR